jgi:cyclase
VKGVAFDSWRSVGLAASGEDPRGMRGVDEVCLLDITATKEGRGPDLTLVEELRQSMFAPLAVGGGIEHLDDVQGAASRRRRQGRDRHRRTRSASC